VPLFLLLLLLPVGVIALTPLLLIQRYRAGSARREARPWVAAMSTAAMAFSAVFFLASAAFTTIWIPHALGGAALGMAVGLGLGVIGSLLTRWEPNVRSLHYTPNRWLVLLVTLIVSGRIGYGLYRSFEAASAGLSGHAMIGAFGLRFSESLVWADAMPSTHRRSFASETRPAASRSDVHTFALVAATVKSKGVGAKRRR